MHCRYDEEYAGKEKEKSENDPQYQHFSVTSIYLHCKQN